MTLLAAFAGAARTATRGQDDVVVGTPIAEPHARRDRGADRLLRQHLVLRADLAGEPDVPRAARAGARDVRSAPTRTRTCPFERLVEELRPERDLEPHAALPGDVRRCRTRRSETLELPGLRAAASRRRRDRTAKFDLTLCRVEERAAGLGGDARVQHRPVRRATPSSGCSGTSRRCSRAIAADPRRARRRAAAARRRRSGSSCSSTWNATARRLPRAACAPRALRGAGGARRRRPSRCRVRAARR